MVTSQACSYTPSGISYKSALWCNCIRDCFTATNPAPSLPIPVGLIFLFPNFRAKFRNRAIMLFDVILIMLIELFDTDIGRGFRGSLEHPSPPPFLSILWKWNNFGLSQTNLFHFHGTFKTYEINPHTFKHMNPLSRNHRSTSADYVPGHII